MTLSVDAERWCEAIVGLDDAESCERLCGDVALTVFATCGTALCDVHEVVCRECRQSYCASCDHVCAVVSQAA